MLIILLLNVNTIMNLLNIIQFVQLPFVIVPLLKMYISPRIMGTFSISAIRFWIMIFLSVLIQIINVISIYSISKEANLTGQIVICCLIMVYLLFIGNL